MPPPANTPAASSPANPVSATDFTYLLSVAVKVVCDCLKPCADHPSHVEEPGKLTARDTTTTPADASVVPLLARP